MGVDANQITSWPDAELFAVDVIPRLSGGVDARHYQVLARRLIAAAARYVALTNGPVRVDEVVRVVRAELPGDLSDASSRPMSRCADGRVVDEIAAVRRCGRIWAAVTAEHNAAAWVALKSLGATYS